MSRLLISILSPVLLVIFQISKQHVILVTAGEKCPVVSKCVVPKQCQPNAMVRFENNSIIGWSHQFIENGEGVGLLSTEECLGRCYTDDGCYAVDLLSINPAHVKQRPCYRYVLWPSLVSKKKKSTSYAKLFCHNVKPTDTFRGASYASIDESQCTTFSPECIFNSMHEIKNMQLSQFMENNSITENMSREECLRMCFLNVKCLMFTMHNDRPNVCLWFTTRAQMQGEESYFNSPKPYTSYIKKRCDNAETELSDTNSYPCVTPEVIIPTEIIVTPENNNHLETKKPPFIPIDAIFIFNPQVQCLASKRELIVGHCKEKAWQIIEFILHTIEYSNLNNDECIQKCQSNDKCTLSSYFLNKNTQETNCKIFQENPIERLKMFPGEIKYKPICCVFNKALPKEYKNKNLIIADNLNKICRQVLEDDVNKCRLHFNVWKREFHVKMTNAHSEQSLSTVENCLNNCLTKDDCTAVSIDFHNKKCFHFIGQTFNKIDGEKDWMSFFIKCCKGLGYF